MPLFNLVGNKPAQTLIARMLQQKRVPNTLLFAGSDGVGKSLFALNLVAALFGSEHRSKIGKGNHPDVHIYRPEGKSGLHSISSMRQLIEEMQLPPFEAPCKAFIIHEAERMLPSASNALLKTFEEPNPDSTIILLSSDPDSLLPTIVSRCQKIPFFPIAEEEILQLAKEQWNLPEENTRQIALIAQGSIAKAKAMIEFSKSAYRQNLIHLLADEVDYPTLLQTLSDIEAALAPPEEEEIPGEWLKQVDALFEEIFHWYRDRHLLHCQKDSSRYFYQNELEQIRLCQKKLPSLERVSTALGECRLAIQRSMKLRTVLEYFFLKA